MVANVFGKKIWKDTRIEAGEITSYTLTREEMEREYGITKKEVHIAKSVGMKNRIDEKIKRMYKSKGGSCTKESWATSSNRRYS